jgi:hypothetical protein
MGFTTKLLQWVKEIDPLVNKHVDPENKPF